MEPNLGLSIHCHHDILIEYCYNYNGRVEVIKRDKPKNEQEIRLRLFKLLPQEAIDELPEKLIKAYAEWGKPSVEWKKADAEWKKTYVEWEKADAEWKKAYVEWEKADQEKWHDKWYGCVEWRNGIINFPKE